MSNFPELDALFAKADAAIAAEREKMAKAMSASKQFFGRHVTAAEFETLPAEEKEAFGKWLFTDYKDALLAKMERGPDVPAEANPIRVKIV